MIKLYIAPPDDWEERRAEVLRRCNEANQAAE